MTKRNKFYQIGFIVSTVVCIGLMLAMGIIAVQKSMKLNLGFQVNPSFECKIVYNGNTIFCNTTKNGENLVVGDGVSLNGNNLTLNQNFSGLGAEFTLTIHNYTTLKTDISVSGTGANGDTLTLDAYSSGTAPNGNITITATGTSATLTFAEWVPKTITLNLNGGTHASATNGEIKLDGEYDCLSLALSVVDDYIPTMTNYTFGGWYSHEIATTAVPNAEEGHTKYFSCNYFTDNSISLAQDLELKGATTLYARWLPFTVGTYSTGTDKPTESGNIVTYTAFAGYKYLKFVGVDSFTATYDSNVTPLRFIVIGAGKNVNSAMKGAYEQTSVTKAAFAGTLANTKDTSAVGTNTEIADNHVLLLSEQLVDRTKYGSSQGNWLDTRTTIRKFLNETTTATNFLPGSGLDDYVTNGFVVKPSTNAENATLANGIITAWTSGTTTDNESYIFLLGSRYGYFYGEGKTSAVDGEIVSQTSYHASYYAQHFVVEDYLGTSDATYTLNGTTYNGGNMKYTDAKLKQFTGLNASYSSYWWLRSGYYATGYYVYRVDYRGYVRNFDVRSNIDAVRPSFILNLA